MWIPIFSTGSAYYRIPKIHFMQHPHPSSPVQHIPWKMAALIAFIAPVILLIGGLIFTAQLVLSGMLSFSRAFLFTLPIWSPWLVFSPLVVWMTARFPVEKIGWKKYAMLHLGALFLICAFNWNLMGQMSLKAAEHLPSHIVLPMGGKPPLGARVVLDVLTYSMLVSVCLAVNLSLQAKERERRALKAESYLTEARLSALRMQLQPHFLFNALNGISTLVHTNPAAADDMIANLSTLLRLSLDRMEEQEIPLRHELDFLRSYLDIEQVRYGNRLICDWDISPDTMTAFLPSLLLQPLVENAIRHGLSPLSRTVTVTVRSWIDEEMLHLQVSDDGAGYRENTTDVSGKSTHIGLNNTRARLAALYGNRQSMSVRGISNENREIHGCIVEIRIPHHTEPIS